MHSKQYFCVGNKVLYRDNTGNTAICKIIDESLTFDNIKRYDLMVLSGHYAGLKIYWVNEYQLKKVE